MVNLLKPVKIASSFLTKLKHMVKALVLLASGSEETEFTASCDILTRAGVQVCRAVVVPAEQGPEVHMAYGMNIWRMFVWKM